MNQNNEINYATKLEEQGYVPGPNICNFGGKILNIQNYEGSKLDVAFLDV